MILTPWLTRVHDSLRKTRRTRRSQKSRYATVPSAVERLEDRTLLAVTAMFTSNPIAANAGLLQVDITAGGTEDVTIDSFVVVDNEVRVNGLPVIDTFTALPALTADVTAVTVFDVDGTPNIIDLTGLTTADYPSLSNGQVDVNANGGDDVIFGSDYADLLRGGGGADYIRGWAGSDTIRGGADSDTLSGDGGHDEIIGQGGNDSIGGGGGDDTLDGNGGDDEIWADSEIDEFGFLTETGSGNDSVSGSAGNDTLWGQGGDDKLNGGSGDDLLMGGAGDDTLFGGSGDDSLFGEDGSDVLRGQGDNDSMDGGDGSDTFYGEPGNDIIDGGIDVGEPDIDHVIQEVDADQKLTDNVLTGNGTDALFNIETAHLIGGAGKNVLDASMFTGGDPYVGIPGEEAWVNPDIGKVTLEGGDGRDTLIGTPFKDDKVLGRLGDFPEDDPIFSMILDMGLLVDDPRKALLTDEKLRLLDSEFVLVDDLTLTALRAGNLEIIADNRGMAPADDNIIRFWNANFVVTDAQMDILDWYGEPFRILKDNRGLGKPTDSVIIFDSTDLLFDIEEGEVIGGLGNNHIDASMFSGPVTLVGGQGADTLIGSDFRDLVPVDPKLPGAMTDNLFKVGGDVLEGGPGSDVLDGRGGRDMIREFGDGDFIFRKDTGSGEFNLLGVNGTDILKSIETAFVEVTTVADPDTGIAPGRTIDVDPFSEISETWLFGGEGPDRILGAHIADYIEGRGGDDTISGRQGNDTIFGGEGNDRLFGGRGIDSIDGGEGDDLIRGQGCGDDHLSNNGATFNLPSVLRGGPGNDTIEGGEGDDAIEGNEGNDSLIGNNGPDTIDGGLGRDTIEGGGGKDLIFGGGTADTIMGGAGDDTIFGEGGHDLIFGNGGNDMLHGQSGNDTVDGGNGDDTVTGRNGNDSLVGGMGNDAIAGGTGNDTLRGNAGADSMLGGAGDDMMFGGPDMDIMLGEAGEDFVDGEGSIDSVTGGGNGNPVEGGDVVFGEVILPFIFAFDPPWANI